jgi:hypothetical protein
VHGERPQQTPERGALHGATLDDFMEHLALLENGDDPATATSWLEHVSDDEYPPPLAPHPGQRCDIGRLRAVPATSRGTATIQTLSTRRARRSGLNRF